MQPSAMGSQMSSASLSAEARLRAADGCDSWVGAENRKDQPRELLASLNGWVGEGHHEFQIADPK